MGFRWRKSINMGPFRFNLSKSGIGGSYGFKGFRRTRTASGKTRTTFSVPGTGMSYVTESSRKQNSRSGGPKKSFFRKWWVWLIAVVLLGACANAANNKTEDLPLTRAAGASAISASEETETTVPVTTKPKKPAVETTIPETSVQTEPKIAAAEAAAPESTDQAESKTAQTFFIPITEAEPKATETELPDTTEPETTAAVITPPDAVTDSEDTGTQYVLNTNSRKYHYPSCSSVDDMKPKNRKDYTGSSEELRKQGYQPCKRCKPF